MNYFSVVALAGALLLSGVSHAVTLGQVDDFQDGTTQGWTEGIPSPNDPINVPDGGPDGLGDSYLENFSDGGFGAGSRQVMFNTSQWTGNYPGVGVSRIAMDLANFGATTLFVRLAFEGADGTKYGSTQPFLLPADGTWYSAIFSLNAAELSLIEGSDTLDNVLANVVEFRILSAQSGPVWEGDNIVATLGVDNISAETDVLTLASPVPGIAGQNNTWTAEGASQNGFVILFIGAAPGATQFPFPPCPGTVIDIQNARFFGFARADGAGAASIVAQVPSAASGLNIRSQAVDIPACTTSNVDITAFQ